MMRLPHMMAMAALSLAAPVAIHSPAIVPAQAQSRQEAKRAARREIYANVSPRFRRSRNKPTRRVLRPNLRHRSRRVRRKHRRAA